jgi:hypothetical protein
MNDSHASLRDDYQVSTPALDPSSAPDMRRAVLARWPTAASDAATRADRILADRYDVLGYRQLEWTSPEGKVDWHLDPVSGRRAPLHFWADVPYLNPASGDHKVIWELNRHQHWLSLGRALWLTRDARYRRIMHIGSFDPERGHRLTRRSGHSTA